MNLRKLYRFLLGLLFAFPIYATDFIVPRLSPLPANVETQKISLSGFGNSILLLKKNFGRKKK